MVLKKKTKNWVLWELGLRELQSSGSHIDYRALWKYNEITQILTLKKHIYIMRKNCYISWLFSYHFGAVPWSNLTGCIPGYSPQKVH